MRRVSSDGRLIIAAVILGFGAAVGLGFGRFAYALLLEPMRADLQWSYAQAGVINSANAVGYLVGTLLVGLAVSQLGSARTLRLGTLIASLSLIATGWFNEFAPLVLVRVLAGIGGGLIYVGGAAVLLEQPSTNPLILGVYYGGPGVGIALSGLGVPWLLDNRWEWPLVWMLMGGAGIVVLALMEWPLRRMQQRTTPTARRSGPIVWADYRKIWPILASFAIYGIGYIGYMTFIVAFLQAQGATTGQIQFFWFGLGLCAAIGGFVWGPLLRRRSSRDAAALVMIALTVATIIPAVWVHPLSFALSAILFGGSFLVTVATVTGEIRRALPPERVATVIGHAVALFATGQLIGPTIIGAVADLPGGLSLGLALSALFLGGAGIVALLGEEPPALRQ